MDYGRFTASTDTSKDLIPPVVIKVTRKDRKSVFAQGVYQLEYKEGRAVKALTGTLGCMCFETLQSAAWFVRVFCIERRIGGVLYLRVEGVEKPSFPEAAACCISEDALHMFYDKALHAPRQMPRGTICYPEVRVLD